MYLNFKDPTLLGPQLHSSGLQHNTTKYKHDDIQWSPYGMDCLLIAPLDGSWIGHLPTICHHLPATPLSLR